MAQAVRQGNLAMLKSVVASSRLRLTSLIGFGAGALMLAPVSVQAEGGSCPPGYYPIGGQGYQGCAPIPGGEGEETPGAPPQRPQTFHERAAASHTAETNSAIADIFIAMIVYDERQRIQRELDQNPTYRRMQAGYWEETAPPPGSLAGDGCSATFVNLDGAVTISGPRGDFRQAAITFWGGNIPVPRRASMKAVTLAQTGGQPPATVQAYHFSMADGQLGAVTFVVPSAAALIGGIYDVHRFDVSMKRQSWVSLAWKDGDKARTYLQSCLQAR